MGKKLLRYGAVFWMLLLGIVTNAAVAAESTLIDFELEDHARTLHRAAEWNGKTVVLFATSREGQTHNQDYVWSAPIADFIAGLPASGEFVLARIADLRIVPRLMRGMARGMTEDAGNPVPLVLTDWDGSFAQAYALDDSSYHLMVFDAQKKLVLHEALQTFNQQQLAAILVRLEAINSATIQP
jgi:hypothetical protein